MPTISIRLTEDQKSELDRLAAESSQNITEYILSMLFTSDSSSNLLTHKQILNEIAKLPHGKEFTIPDLFPNTWDTFTNTISVGRTFRIAQKTENSAVNIAVDFVSKKSGSPAVYKKK